MEPEKDAFDAEQASVTPSRVVLVAETSVTPSPTGTRDQSAPIIIVTKLGLMAKLVRESFLSGDCQKVQECLAAIGDHCKAGPESMQHKNAFLLAGGFAFTVLVMEKWPKEATIHLPALRVLTNAMHQVDINVSDLGVIEATLGTFETFPNNAKMAHTAMIGLNNACSGNSVLENLERLVDAGGAEMVVKAMLRFPNHDELQLWGCRLLAKAGRVKKLATQVFRARSIQLLADLVDNQHHTEELRNAAKTAAMVILKNVEVTAADD